MDSNVFFTTPVLMFSLQDKTAKCIYYGRWKNGEVDLVSIHHGRSEPQAAIEIKWSDLAITDSREISGPLDFCEQRNLRKLWVTTRTTSAKQQIGNVEASFVPTSLSCLVWGKWIVDILEKNDDWSFPD